MKKKNLFFISAAVVSIFLAIVSFKSATEVSDYSLSIVNKHWNNMHVQVRVGNNQNPELNPLVFDGNLSRNGSTGSIPYDVLCYYRRDQDPDHPNGYFTNWTSAGCFRGTPCTVDNP